MDNQISCFFLIIFSFYLQGQARESKFFSKSLHLTTSTLVTIPSTNPKHVPLAPSPSPITSHIGGVPASAPTTLGAGYGSAPAPTTVGAGYDPAPAPATMGAGYDRAPAPATLGAGYAPAPAPPENDMPYYGLYVKNNNNNNNNGEEESPSENPEEVNNRGTYSYSNGESNSLSNNNGFWTSEQRSYYSTNNGYDLESEPQGMSDSRLVDNGRYYSDVGQEKYNPRGSNYGDDNGEGYYGNYRSKYEFDSMEEYEKQEGYGDVEQFIP